MILVFKVSVQRFFIVLDADLDMVINLRQKIIITTLVLFWVLIPEGVEFSSPKFSSYNVCNKKCRLEMKYSKSLYNIRVSDKLAGELAVKRFDGCVNDCINWHSPWDTFNYRVK